MHSGWTQLTLGSVNKIRRSGGRASFTGRAADVQPGRGCEVPRPSSWKPGPR